VEINKMNELIALLIALAVHEFGHYTHYLILGFKPKFGWIGIGPCVEPQVKDIAVKYVLLNIVVAIMSGAAVLKYFAVSDIAMFAYIVGCFMDMNNAQMILIYIYRKTIDWNTNVNSIKVVIGNKVVA
jgi:hypothetical protein